MLCQLLLKKKQVHESYNWKHKTPIPLVKCGIHYTFRKKLHIMMTNFDFVSAILDAMS